MDPVKKLDEMLEEAGIPHEYNVEPWGDMTGPYRASVHGFCEADKFSLNQIVYGRLEADIYKISAIWQRGSYGRVGHLLEAYGSLIGRSPKILSTEDVFKLIEADWKEQ